MLYMHENITTKLKLLLKNVLKINWHINSIKPTVSFTFMHLADAFIQSDLQC